MSEFSGVERRGKLFRLVFFFFERTNDRLR